MAKLLDEKLAMLSPLDKASVFRIVMDEDAVCRIPSHKTGYSHVGRTIFLTTDDEVLVNPRVDLGLSNLWMSNNGSGKMKDLAVEENVSDPTEQIVASEMKNEKEEDDGNADSNSSKYQKMVAKIPKPFRDHCPDCYLEPLIALYERERKKNNQRSE